MRPDLVRCTAVALLKRALSEEDGGFAIAIIESTLDLVFASYVDGVVRAGWAHLKHGFIVFDAEVHHLVDEVQAVGYLSEVQAVHRSSYV